PLSGAKPAGDEVVASGGSIVIRDPMPTGSVALLGLTGIRASEVPEDAVQAKAPPSIEDGISGVVWRDFSPGGGTPGVIEPGEMGLPGVTVEIRGPDGSQTTKTNPD